MSALPERPSLEQLKKQAKELVRDNRAATLADAQFALAREYGFETWADLKHHIDTLQPLEDLARQLADAYTAGHATAIREINWKRGTSFIWDREPIKMQQRLPTWFASQARTHDLALADARHMIAHSYGFEGWATFAISAAKPFYKIDAKTNTIKVQGPQSDSNWDHIFGVMKEEQIAALNAPGITDAAVSRLADLSHVTQLHLGVQITDAGVLHLARMPQLQQLDLSGWKGQLTDRALEALRHLPELRRFQMTWQQNITDAGIANLAHCDRLERVNLLGTPTGDGASARLPASSISASSAPVPSLPMPACHSSTTSPPSKRG